MLATDLIRLDQVAVINGDGPPRPAQRHSCRGRDALEILTTSDPAIREREVRARREAMATLGQKEATIVTVAAGEGIRVAEGMVRVIAMWRWTIERAASM